MNRISHKGLFFLPFIIAFVFSACQKETGVLLTPNSNLQPPVVNAGNSQVIQLPASTFTLNGSATSTNGSIKAYLWSMVSGSNVPSINSPGSKITTVTGFVAGNYIFQLMATDSAGLTGVDTTSVQVNPSPIITLTLQPANNPNERHLLGNSTTYNQGANATEFSAAAWTISGDVIYLRGLFKFDLSSIPTTATILTAKLSLYSNPTPLNGNLIDANSGPNNSFYIRRITSNWSPPTTFWQNQPPTTATDQVSIPHTNQVRLDLIDIDVRNLVASMLGSNNYGFKIELQNEMIYNIRNFCSSTYPDATKHPKIVITYQP